jgi:hypothetical protein
LSTQDEYTKVGNFSKPQVKDFVRQNVEAIIRNTPNTVLVRNNNQPFVLDSATDITDGWKSKEAIIVKDKDLTILENVPLLSGGKPRAIIVLNGNIKIGPNVTEVHASIFTDK